MMTGPLKKIFLGCEAAVNRLLYQWAPDPAGGAGAIYPRRVLISKLDSVGDSVLFSAALPAFRELYPDAFIVLLVRETIFNLAETCPYVDEVWSINPGRFRTAIIEHWRWYRRIIQGRFDLAINAKPSAFLYFTDCIAGWSRASRRIAFECTDEIITRTEAYPYYTELVPDAGRTRFEIDRYYDMLRQLGFAGSEHKPELWLTDDDRTWAARCRDSFRGKPYVMVFPGAFAAQRRWPAENFIRSIREIDGQRSLHWVICGSADEAELCGMLAAELQQGAIAHTVSAGTATLREIAALMQGAAFYLGNETGGAHIAAAAGIPVFCIQGGGHYGRFFPYPDSPLTVAITHRMPCYNCGWQCDHEELECLSRVSVEVVVAEVGKALADI